jgi:hypothetical protein
MAAGGILRAMQPTTVEMAEREPETAIFIPDSSRSSATGMMGFGGVSQSTLDINVRITADGNFSQEFEDKMYAALADTIGTILPANVRRR